MCGIIGAVSNRNIITILLEGLQRLEYRGYDSAGIAFINMQQTFERYRALGNIQQLNKLFNKDELFSHTGIAHTRWATHGKPSEKNAHPHIIGGTIALVHNGIVENHQVIRERLLKENVSLLSETDSELVGHLVFQKIQAAQDFLSAVRETTLELEGSSAFVFIKKDEPGRLIATTSGSPLVIGIGHHEHFVSSDPLAVSSVTKQFIYLKEGDIADVYIDKIIIHDANGKKIERSIHTLDAAYLVEGKGEYPHFMLKEIMEQPYSIESTLQGRIKSHSIIVEMFGEKAPQLFKQVHHVQLVACGTSYHAALIAKYWLEDIARVHCDVEIASEYRYRRKVVGKNTLFVSISQSGETADTLAALREAKKSGFLSTLAVCNAAESSLVRESDIALMTNAGVEIGVASTKAFTTQLVALLLLTLSIGRNHPDEEREAGIVNALHHLPLVIKETLLLNDVIRKSAAQFSDKHHAIYVGRGTQYPIALEGALKLKEISYIHAEAYPAGELKHGPLALIDPLMPVVALAPNDGLIEKLKSNLEEIVTREGKLLIFADKNANINRSKDVEVIEMPAVHPYLAPIVYTIPMQLLAYHIAVIKETDIDKPRNLAKSVTVE